MKQEAKKIAELINVSLPIPTKEEIEKTVSMIKERFKDKKINMTKNLPVKEGYTQAIEVLKSGKLDYSNVSSIQGRAIVAIAFDYLNGECSQEVLVNVPLKSQF